MNVVVTAIRKNHVIKTKNSRSLLSYTTYLLFFGMSSCLNLHAISIVYHFRISQITKQPIFEHLDTNYTLIVLFFDQVLKTYHGDIHKNFVGDLNAFIYNFKPYYFRADMAFAYVTETIRKLPKFSGLETDDILFTLGRNFKIDDVAKITLSGLFGIPTHKNRVLEHAQLAFAQVSIGLQLDGTYKFNYKDTFIWGLRSLYFIPRRALVCSKERPIFTVGTLSDVLFAYKHDWDNQDFEIGVTERFQLGAHSNPNLDHVVQETNFIRTNFYIAYKYKFLIRTIHNRIAFELGYSFDNTPKKYGYKYIIIGWVTLNTSF